MSDFVMHELAHVLTFQGCKSINDYLQLESNLRPLYTNGISLYNWQAKDGAETIAEAFVKIGKGGKVNEDASALVRKYVEVWRK